MKVIQCSQLSMEWVQAHCAVVSGSYMGHVLDFTQKGLPGAKRKSYLKRKLGELLSGRAVHQNYVSWEMTQGIEREPAARLAYEMEEGVMVEEIGFALHDTIPRWGGSVDGLVGDDGFVEFKSPTDGMHAEYAEMMADGVVPPEYIPQINSYFSITGRLWCDFSSFADVPKPMRIVTLRVPRDQAAVDRIEAAVIAFNAEIDAKIEKLRQIFGPFDLPAAEAAKVAPAPQYQGEDAFLSAADFEGLV